MTLYLALLSFIATAPLSANDWQVTQSETDRQRYVNTKIYGEVTSLEKFTEHFEKAVAQRKVSAVRYLLEQNKKHQLSFNINTQNDDGDTVIHRVARNDDVSMLKILLANGADPRIANKRQQSVFAAAVDSGAPNVLAPLLKASPGLIEVADAEGQAPLAAALRNGNLFVAKKLTKLGANTDIKIRDAERKIKDKATTAKTGDMIDAVDWVMKRDDFEAFQIIFSSTASRKKYQDIAGNTLLHKAATYGSRAITDHLLKDGLSYERVNKQEEFPFQIALANGNLQTYALYLKRDPKLVNYQNIDGDTVAHLAAERLDADVLDFIANAGVDFSLKNTSGKTAQDVLEIMIKQADEDRAKSHEKDAALFEANVGKSKLVFKTLSEKRRVQKAALQKTVFRGKEYEYLTTNPEGKRLAGEKFLDVVRRKPSTSSGETVLHQAVNHKNVELIEKILHADPQLVNQRAFDGHTPMTWAQETCSVDAIKVFEKLGYFKIEPRLCSWYLSKAISNSSLACMRFLFDRGCGPASESDHRNILHALPDNPSSDVMELLFSHPDIKKAALAKSSQGHTPLQAAVLKLSKNAIQAAVAEQFKVDLKVAVDDDIKLIERFINLGSDINASSPNWPPALTLAVGSGDFKVAERLIRAGASINLKAYNHSPPFCAIQRYPSREAVMFFLEHGADPNVHCYHSPLLNVVPYDLRRLLVQNGARLDQLHLTIPNSEFVELARDELLYQRKTTRQPIEENCQSSRAKVKSEFLAARSYYDQLLDGFDESLRWNYKNWGREFPMTYRRLQTMIDRRNLQSRYVKAEKYDGLLKILNAQFQDERSLHEVEFDDSCGEIYLKAHRGVFDEVSSYETKTNYKLACDDAAARYEQYATVAPKLDINAYLKSDKTRQHPLTGAALKRAIDKDPKQVQLIFARSLKGKGSPFYLAIEYDLLGEKSLDEQLKEQRQNFLKQAQVDSEESFIKARYPGCSASGVHESKIERGSVTKSPGREEQGLSTEPATGTRAR